MQKSIINIQKAITKINNKYFIESNGLEIIIIK